MRMQKESPEVWATCRAEKGVISGNDKHPLDNANRPKLQAPKQKRSAAEKLLDGVRRKPSPRSRDPRQLDLIDHLTGEDRRRAFARLEEAIAETLEKGGRR